MEMKVIFSVCENYNSQIKILTVMDLKLMTQHEQLQPACSVKNTKYSEQNCERFLPALFYPLSSVPKSIFVYSVSFQLTYILVSPRNIQRCTLTNYPSPPRESSRTLVKAFRQLPHNVPSEVHTLLIKIILQLQAESGVEMRLHRDMSSACYPALLSQRMNPLSR